MNLINFKNKNEYRCNKRQNKLVLKELRLLGTNYKIS